MMKTYLCYNHKQHNQILFLLSPVFCLFSANTDSLLSYYFLTFLVLEYWSFTFKNNYTSDFRESSDILQIKFLSQHHLKLLSLMFKSNFFQKQIQKKQNSNHVKIIAMRKQDWITLHFRLADIKIQNQLIQFIFLEQSQQLFKSFLQIWRLIKHIIIKMKAVLAFALLVAFISSVSLKESHQWTEYEDDTYPTLTDHWVLTFDHASRNGVRQDSNSFTVNWNGQRIREWHPTDYNIHSERIDLTSRIGKNSIHFIGTGISDSLGQGLDNVKLFRNSFCGYEDAIINGGFEQGHNLGRGWRFFANGAIPGWTTPDNQLEVGYGRIYNPRWPADTHITQLDANHNTDVSQTFELDEWQRIEGVL